jgi:hypothetical protein
MLCGIDKLHSMVYNLSIGNIFLIHSKMNYSISDFKTGQDISTPAKVALWDNIIKRTFGGMDCALRQYEKHSAFGSWKSYKLNGMITYLDELTGGDYGKKHPQIARVGGTLATQFKVKFPAICYLLSNQTITVLDREFDVLSIKEKTVKSPSPKKSSIIDRKKVHSILAEIYSRNLSEEESKFIGETLVSV